MSEAETGTEIVPAAIITPAAGIMTGLSAAAQAAVDAGMPENTRRNYERHWREFTEWCAETGRAPLPASTTTMVEYITYLCRQRPARDRRGNLIPGVAGMSPASVRLARWAIIKAHELAEAPPPYEKRALQVISGYEKELAKAHDSRAKPRKAKAITLDELRELATTGIAGLGPLAEARDRAMFLLGFHAATRVSELASIDIGDVQATSYGLLLSLYRGKTKSSYEEVVIPSDHAPTAVRAVLAWIAVLKEHGRESGPLFPRISKSGVIGAVHYGDGGEEDGSPDGRMSLRCIEDRFKYAAAAAGLEGRITVHSMRRGVATAARLAGHDKIRIARHGGWADDSSALNGYMEDADRVTHSPLKGAGI